MNKQIYILKIKWIDGGGFNEEFNSSQELFDRLAEIEENKKCDFKHSIFVKTINDVTQNFYLDGRYKYMWVNNEMYDNIKEHVSNGNYIAIESPYKEPIILKEED